MLIIGEIIVLITFLIDIDLVTSEDIRKCRSHHMTRIECQVETGHNPHPQSQGQVDVGHQSPSHGNVGIHLHGHHLLRIEAHTEIQLRGFLLTARKHSLHPFAGLRQMVRRFLIEQVDPHGRRNEFRLVRSQAFVCPQMKLCTDILLVDG